jgi:hypothetical protein
MTRSVATETEVLVEIDQQTKDELQPPCDARVMSVPCDNPASWIAWIACPQCGARAALECDQHIAELRAEWLVCTPCCKAERGNQTVRLVHSEPLR